MSNDRKRREKKRDKATQPLVYQVQREFDRVAADLQERLDKLVADGNGLYANPEVRNVQIAQNTLRTCMEATLQKMMPYTHLTAIELAIRLASYALSTVPMEDQDMVKAQFMESFIPAHDMRMARNVRIDIQWRMEDGRDVPNFPDDGTPRGGDR